MFDQQLYQGPTIGDLIIIALQKFKDRVAFKEYSRAVTFGELEIMIGRAVAALDSLGVRKGDAVAQIAGNATEAFAITAACYIQGYRSVPLQAASSINDHIYAVEDSEAVVVIVDDEHIRNGIEIKRALGDRVQVRSYQAENGDIGPFWTGISPKLPLTNEVEPGDIVRLAYTGGTTGLPKGVMASSRSLATCTINYMAAQPWESDIKYLCATPMSHGGGSIILPTLLKGGCTVLQQKFDPSEVIRAIEREGITRMMAVPTMLYALLDHPNISKANLKSMRRILYGAAPISPARLREALAIFGPVFIQGYGQTEAPATILILSQEDHLTGDDKRLESVGTPYPGVLVKLLNDDCKPVPQGEIGEICVRGPLVMSGYWKKPELTADALRGGWLHTGDLAYQDQQGYFFIVDRKKDMIISGGVNVYPKEVENALTTHPAVSAAAVIGVPDEKWGEAVKAIVVLRPSEKVSSEELIAFTKKLKGPVQAPKSVDFVEALPLTSLGKIDKKSLRAPYWKGVTRQVNG
ncbi:AMP-binding protein [Bradyrhizobium sp. CCBAU 51753]|uniref:AMP-binding protein n=1 Tax=Bradyrhizobium sp. CCBAU 51753 TaxID=1325100 RepID=UPI00188B65D2|nr:AMP-binding protein [Bradyrhizobium sp. CCBAU 51753]QOZ23865.1 acyl-CoA synthetase [Bradyrhizobium sp. CCBAU 51753]